jgi:hypothetical protein
MRAARRWRAVRAVMPGSSLIPRCGPPRCVDRRGIGWRSGGAGAFRMHAPGLVSARDRLQRPRRPRSRGARVRTEVVRGRSAGAWPARAEAAPNACRSTTGRARKSVDDDRGRRARGAASQTCMFDVADSGRPPGGSDAGPTAGSPAATTRVRPAAAPAGRIAGAATRPSPAAPVAGATPARPVRGAHRAGLRAAPRRREGRVSEAVYAGQRQAGQRKGDDDQPRDSSRPAAEHAAACAAVGLEGAEAHDDPARSAGHRSRRTQAVRRTTDRSRRAHRRSVVEAGPRSASAGPVRRLSRTHSPRPVPR